MPTPQIPTTQQGRIRRRALLQATCGAMLANLLPHHAAAAPKAARRPNVLLILTDDQGWDDLGCHGNTMLRTPHLDALARSSVQCANYYVAAVCAPTRASLLTGRHFLRTGVAHVHGGKDFVHTDETLLSQIFQQAGYRTGMWGKWHSGKTSGYLPWERGFDEAYMARLYQHRDSVGHLNGEPQSHPGWTVDTLTDMALAFMARHRAQPWFAFVPYLTVHTPLHAPDAMVAAYERAGLARWLATAYAMLEQLDGNIGRLLDTLDTLGLARDTIVVFMSDNGPQYMYEQCSARDLTTRYVSGYKGHKGDMWENGIKSPLFVRWPGQLAPRTVQRMCDVCDILPTLLELCGIPLPPSLPRLDGRSVVSYLRGDEASLPPKESFIYVNPAWPPHEHAPRQYCPAHETEYDPVPPEIKAALPFGPQCVGLRTERHKLMNHPGVPAGMTAPAEINGQVLIDVADDPRENRNVAALQPAITTALQARLYAWFEQIKAEPHAFAAPCFAVGPGTTNTVLLYAPVRLRGTLHNNGLMTSGWDHAGAGADYSVEVRAAGQYRITLQPGVDGAVGVTLRVRIAGQDHGVELRDGGAGAGGTLDLPAGRQVLQVDVCSSAPAGCAGLGRAATLLFSPAAAAPQ